MCNWFLHFSWFAFFQIIMEQNERDKTKGRTKSLIDSKTELCNRMYYFGFSPSFSHFVLSHSYGRGMAMPYGIPPPHWNILFGHICDRILVLINSIYKPSSTFKQQNERIKVIFIIIFFSKLSLFLLLTFENVQSSLEKG